MKMPDEQIENAYDVGGKALHWAVAVTGGDVQNGGGGQAGGEMGSEYAWRDHEGFLQAARRDGFFAGEMEDARAGFPTTPFPNGDKSRDGIETRAVVRSGDGKTVRKYRPTIMDGVGEVVDKLRNHNVLFGAKTPYRMVNVLQDSKSWSGGLVEPIVVADQPYVEFEPNSAEKAKVQLLRDMKERFGEAHFDGDGELHVGNERFVVSDLKPANIGIDKADGKYAVIDCNIHRGEGYEDGGDVHAATVNDF